MKTAHRPHLSRLPRLAGIFCLCLLLTALDGCTPRALIQSELADALAAQGSDAEDDPDLARDAAPFYLKLSESVLKAQPGHRPLAESVAAGFAGYAYAFVALEADRLEASDVEAAARLRQRAAALYRRANGHATGALAARYPDFWPRLRKPLTPGLALAREDAGLAYWAAASWGGWIALSKDDPEVVADLPLAIRLAELAYAADPAWGAGSLSSLLASFEMARPGGQRPKALQWFDEGIALAGDSRPGPLLAKAEGYALALGERELFESLLRRVLAQPTPGGQFALQDRIMRRRAAWLLEQAPDLF